MIQRLQILLHQHLLEKIFDSPNLIRPPLFMRMADWFPMLQRLTTRAIGMGLRPEHIAACAEEISPQRTPRIAEAEIQIK